MSRLDDLIEEMLDAGREDDAAELKALRGPALREKAARLPALEAEQERLKAEGARLKRAPLIEEAFRTAGVDFGALSKIERRAIDAYEGPLDEEAVFDFIEENELPAR